MEHLYIPPPPPLPHHHLHRTNERYMRDTIICGGRGSIYGTGLEGLWGSNVWDHWRACGGLMCGTIGGLVGV